MILLEKVVKDDVTGYLFTPEKRGEPGLIIFDLEKQEAEISKLSEEDKKFGDTYYAHKALGAVYRMMEEGKLEDRKLLAWY